MAINKRKDAAALFELIDKSTLKVPKNAGQLKIPSWWSSRTNPATAAVVPEYEDVVVPESTSKAPPSPPHPHTPAEARQSTPKAPAEAVGNPVVKADWESGTAVAVADAPAAEAPVVQHRLFDPYSHPEESPSIRPPVKAAVEAEAPSGTAEAALPPAIAPSIAPAPRAKVQEKQEPAKPSAAPPPTQPHRLPIGVFAPRTMDPTTISRRNWMGQQKTKLAHIPMSALAGLASLVAIIVFLGIYLMWPRHTLPTAARGSGGGVPALGLPGSSGQPHLVTPATSREVEKVIAPVPGTPVPGGLGTTSTAGTERGKVYGAGEVARTADMMYLMIASSTSETIAKKNAELLAEHGVSVSIEVNMIGANKDRRMYVILSAQGFPKQNEAAEAFRKRVVLEIGRQHPDYLKTKKDVWATAIWVKVTAKKS